MTLDAGPESTNVPIAYITKFLMSLFFSIASIAYIIVEYSEFMRISLYLFDLASTYCLHHRRILT